ncbi:MAG: hypothetical protein EOO89_18485 [Pedobacter sp.]|nr:MAG: hypothetical protein EOO89_18485 [Pedobacter sp.]
MMNYKTEAIKGEDLMLKYKVLQPEPGVVKLGLILLLHGVGSNEEDLFRFAESFPKGFVIVSARAPYTLAPGKYAWFELNYSAGKPIINPE